MGLLLYLMPSKYLQINLSLFSKVFTQVVITADEEFLYLGRWGYLKEKNTKL